MKIKLAILEKDIGYLKKLETTFHMRYADKLEIYTFTDESMIYERLLEKKINVFLASDIFDIDTGRIPPSCGFAYMVESGDIKSVKEQPAICKFQKAELIYKSILNIFAEKISSAIELGGHLSTGCRLICFASPAGGVGNSMAAAACAVYMAKRNKRVLYLNLELLGNSDLYFQAEGEGNFGDVIRAVKSRKKNLALKIESVVKHDKGTFFFSGTASALDMGELTVEETERLLSELAVMGAFDDIIIDMDFALSEKEIRVFKKCDRIVVVTDGSAAANQKTMRAFAALEIMGQQAQAGFPMKCNILYNRFSTHGSCKLEGQEIEELGGINRFEGYSTEQLLQQLAGMSVFEGLM